MAAEIFPVAKAQFVDNNGKVLSLGSVEITYTNTANPAPTYKDGIKSSQNDYPILLTAAGKADIYLEPGSYNIVTKDAEGVVVDTTYNYIVEQASSSTPGSGNVPIGGIIMYNGLLADIPVEWHLCDGISGTPDLTHKFIRGTVLQGEIGDEGGSADAVLVSHTHPMPHTHEIDHNHSSEDTSTVGSYDANVVCEKDGGGIDGFSYPNAESGSTNQYDLAHAGDAGGREPLHVNIKSHHHSVNLPEYTGDSGGSSKSDTGSTGESGIDTNLPPYYTLAFIQRIS